MLRDRFVRLVFRVAHAGRWALVLLVFVAACTHEDADEERSAHAGRDYQAVQAAVEGLSSRYPEATDTAVRDSVLIAVYCSVVHDEPVPADFAMFSAGGDRAVRSIVLDFVERTRAETVGMTEEERIEVLFGDSWRTDVYLQRRDCDRGVSDAVPSP